MVSDSVLHTDRESSILSFGTNIWTSLGKTKIDHAIFGTNSKTYVIPPPDFSAEYCSWCDFSEGEPEDDCFCDENCGAIGCQGSNEDLRKL